MSIAMRIAKTAWKRQNADAISDLVNRERNKTIITWEKLMSTENWGIGETSGRLNPYPLSVRNPVRNLMPRSLTTG